MLFLRSLVFNLLFYVGTLVIMILLSPVFLLPRKWAYKVVPTWSYFNFFLLRYICNVNSEVKGWENIPEGGCIIAAKHQSAWETFALFPGLSNATFILKAELRKIPLFGWYIWKLKQIPVNRGRKGVALAQMSQKAKEAIAESRQIIIFPEGTRRPAGAEPKYKYGIVHLYKTLNCPVVPVALNSGVYWPRRRFFRLPGTITAQILPPIQPGLEPEVFLKTLTDKIETASNTLFDQAAEKTPDNFIVKEALAKRKLNSGNGENIN
ncbi:lysophospholipid acyltransferase family protein [Polycladidibacter stylochi]|uniref:lysophospholipid acyltransferase family protein n=1 Tax=Polycladidibacter stylochi TaxID=1807766 RepID=UPI0008335FB4|nr:lysophospholipid acyltransferase family protein [Pseudovibrio stylochi]